jgi:uncharacterized Fe-S cluster protein YjdI/CDGSH-type Zn-finger protein
MSRKLQVYEADGLTVTFDAQRCIHHGHCVRTLPSVFNTAARPWVQPGRATADEVMAVVAGCPTGALQAARSDGGSATALVPDVPVQLRIGRHGPIFVRGAVEVSVDDGSPLAADSRVALCRCGLSARKPFCDNSHRSAGWRDAAASPAPDTAG